MGGISRGVGVIWCLFLGFIFMPMLLPLAGTGPNYGIVTPMNWILEILWIVLLIIGWRWWRTKRHVVQPHHSRYIPQDVKIAVANRCGGVCAHCGSNYNLQFDHIVPFSWGGETTADNLQLLCETCNRIKSNHYVG